MKSFDYVCIDADTAGGVRSARLSQNWACQAALMADVGEDAVVDAPPRMIAEKAAEWVARNLSKSLHSNRIGENICCTLTHAPC